MRACMVSNSESSRILCTTASFFLPLARYNGKNFSKNSFSFFSRLCQIFDACRRPIFKPDRMYVKNTWLANRLPGPFRSFLASFSVSIQTAFGTDSGCSRSRDVRNGGTCAEAMRQDELDQLGGTRKVCDGAISSRSVDAKRLSRRAMADWCSHMAI